MFVRSDVSPRLVFSHIIQVFMIIVRCRCYYRLSMAVVTMSWIGLRHSLMGWIPLEGCPSLSVCRLGRERERDPKQGTSKGAPESALASALRNRGALQSALPRVLFLLFSTEPLESTSESTHDLSVPKTLRFFWKRGNAAIFTPRPQKSQRFFCELFCDFLAIFLRFLP